MTYRELYEKYRVKAIENGMEETAIKLLIQELSNYTRTEFLLNYNETVSDNVLNKILNAISDYLNKGIPIQYILGYTYFYGLKFIVNNNVLIPRRETEELVDYIIHNNPFSSPNILDIGTGSGVIPITLKAHIDDCSITATDISLKAIEVAKLNAKINIEHFKDQEEINFIYSDVFSSVNGKFDIIVSNPPYIDSVENVDKLVYNNEPHLALFSKDNGLYFYKKILVESKDFLKAKSLIIFEIPEDKDEKLKEIVNENYPNSNCQIIRDLQGKSRILIIQNNWR